MISIPACRCGAPASLHRQSGDYCFSNRETEECIVLKVGSSRRHQCGMSFSERRRCFLLLRKEFRSVQQFVCWWRRAAAESPSNGCKHSVPVNTYVLLRWRPAAGSSTLLLCPYLYETRLLIRRVSANSQQDFLMDLSRSKVNTYSKLSHSHLQLFQFFILGILWN
jgi:hypothetical protein